MGDGTALEFLFFAALALALGLKHSFDVDHVVAVSNLLTRQPRLDRALGMSLAWALGHMVTAGLVSAVVYLFAEAVMPFTSRFEILVPFLLIGVGLWGLLAEGKRLHYHRHAHGASGGEHAHLHAHVRNPKHDHGLMAGIGVLHGLASNDELLIVLVVGLGAASVWEVLGGVALFSLGVVVGMAIYATAVHAASGPVQRRFGWNWVPTALTLAFSLASIVYAVYLLAGGEGLNLVQRWMNA